MFSSFGAPNPFPSNNNQNLNTFNQNCAPFGVITPFFGSAQRPTTSGTLGFGQVPAKDSPFASSPFANTSIFGQPKPATPVPPEPSFGVFKSFGTPDPLGTCLKFKTTKDNESIFKSGISHHMGINYQSITCMKEYENKSFEELRYEDYQLNRKGIKSGFPIQNNNTPLLSTSPATTSFFGNQENKLNFSQPGPSSAPMTQIFGPTQSSVFGMNTTKPATNTYGSSLLCDVSMSQTSPGFNTQPNLFNNNAVPVPQFNFSVPPGSSFGQTSSSFNQNQNIISSPFAQSNQNKPVSFNLTPTQTTNSCFLPQTNTINTTPNFNPTLLNAPKMFNLPTNTTGSLLEKPKASPTSGFPLTYGTNLFGNTPKPSPLFNFNQLGKLSVPAPCLPSMTPTSVCQASNTLPNQNQHQQIISMASTPYGACELLNNITPVGVEVKQFQRITSPQELNLLLKTVQTKTAPVKQKNITSIYYYENKEKVFDGLEYHDETLVSNIRVNDNPKRLIIPNVAKYYTDSTFQSVSFTETDSITEPKCLTEEQISTNNLISETGDSCICCETKTETKGVQTEEQKTVETKEQYCECSSIDLPKHPTGIILTRPEYYTVPSLNELVKYINEDGSCYVQGFTIGRYGYGNVYFPDTINVSNLNIDEIVHFRHKEITVYPDDNKKPPKGYELNRRAQVTLDKVWPKDKKTKELITDVNILEEINYVGKLKHLCEKQSTTFVDYRPDTGSWVFRVPEF